jgi:hypothetical protein
VLQNFLEYSFPSVIISTLIKKRCYFFTLGTNDNTIRERFLPNAHWRALFVEPISINFLDLTNFLSHNNVSDRSHAIQAAVTNECASPTIIVKTPILDKVYIYIYIHIVYIHISYIYI